MSLAAPPVARNALLNLITLLVPLAVAFITLPLMISGLGAERFGVLSIAWLLLTYLSELGFGTTTTYYSAEAIGAGRESDLAAVFWTATALQLTVAIGIGIALAATAPLLVNQTLRIPPAIASEARVSLFLLSASLPFLAYSRSLRGLIEAAQRFDLQLAIQTPITIGTYVLAALGAQAGWALSSIMMLIIGVRLLTIPAYYIAARAALPGVSLRVAVDLHRVREIVSFGSWATVSTLVSPVLMYLDRFMIGVLLSMTAVTFYVAPFEIVARLTLIPLAASGALFPALTQLNAVADRAAAQRIAQRGVAILAAVIAPVVILVLGSARDLLAIWLGPEYATQSALALQILAVGVLVNAFAHVPYALLHSARRPDLPARFHLLELPLQIVLAWLLISRFGITGAALAWTLRMLIDATLLFAATHRTQTLKLRAPEPQLWLIMMGGIAAPALGALIVATLAPTAALRLVATGALAIASASLLWLTSISAAERRRVTALFRPAA